jgi:predicted ATPase/transcriptional regulator with XRE-family HTH domain
LDVQSPRDPADAEEARFGGLLRRHRQSAGLSQEDLAGRAGLSVDAVAALERGRRRAPRPLTARMLAKALSLEGLHRSEFLRVAAGASTDGAIRSTPPPASPTELIGRSTELGDVIIRLTQTPTRLLTLTGPGGVGKTRLAMEAARACADRLNATLTWVSLEGLVTGEPVAPAIAADLGLRVPASVDPIDELAGAIDGQRILLVLDNGEHVVDDCASVAAALLDRCDELRVLVTSRELFGVAGEAVLPVRPLAVPPLDCPTERLVGSPAVRLFLARAAARGVSTVELGMSDVGRVVRRLDGMPLALELAAARLNVLTVGQIAAELDESFQILNRRERFGPERHRTMRQAIAWSYDLLDDRERRCLAAFSVFVGGWTREAAAAVVRGVSVDDAKPSESEVLDLIGRLVDRSLLVVRQDGPQARYDMLLAIRDYAHCRLDELGLDDAVSRRHAEYFADFVELASSELRGRRQGAWLGWLDDEFDNIRAAIRWSIGRRETDLALRLVGSLWSFCYLRGHYTEGRSLLESALDLGRGRLWGARAGAMLGAGMLAFLQCEYEVATRWIEAALAEYRAHDDRAGTALCLLRLGNLARERADYDRASDLNRQGRELYDQLGDRSGVAWADNHLGFVAWLRGDLETAERHCTAAFEAFREFGDDEGVIWSLISLGVVSLYRGDLDDAERKLNESRDVSQRLGFREGVAWSLNQLGAVEFRRGRIERAVHLLDESLAEHRDLGDRWRIASVMEALADIAWRRGRPDYAAFLLGAATTVRHDIGAPVPGCEAAQRDSCVAATREALDDADFDAAWKAGQRAPLHAVAEGYPPRR